MQANLPMGGNIITGSGTPSATTDVPNKAYVDGLVASFFSTGDVKLTIKNVADTGWILCNDSSIGSAASGAGFANSSAQALFLLIYANILDAWAPVQTSSGVASTRAAQGTAATAWAANCRLFLPAMLGRALAIAGSGSGLTARPIGSNVGEETHLLTASEIPSITSGVTQTITVTAVSGTIVGTTSTLAGLNTTNTGTPFTAINSGGFLVSSLSGNNTINVTSNNTSGASHNNMQPSSFLTAMIKL